MTDATPTAGQTLTIPQRIAQWLNSVTGLASVTAVPVGASGPRGGDGLVIHPAETSLDKSWGDLFLELTDAREAWQKNPLARRLVGLVTSYTVGTGIQLQCDYAPLNRFLTDFWQHNNIDMRLDEWSDELSRSGELFPVLFHNPVSHMATVRTVPACRIESVE